MKVLICDYTGIAAQWLDQFIIRKNFEVVGVVTPTSDKKLLAEKSWEYVLVFEQGARQIFAALMQFMNISSERVIYALDWESWAMHPAATYNLINPAGGGGGVSSLDFQHCPTVKLFHGGNNCGRS